MSKKHTRVCEHIIHSVICGEIIEASLIYLQISCISFWPITKVEPIGIRLATDAIPVVIRIPTEVHPSLHSGITSHTAALLHLVNHGLGLHNTYFCYAACGADYYFAQVILPEHCSNICMGV